MVGRPARGAAPRGRRQGVDGDDPGRPVARLARGWLCKLTAALLAWAACGGWSEATPPVVVEAGRVSATFRGTPAREALEAVRAATGMEVVLPDTVHETPLTLSVERLPLERFLQRVVEALDLGGFALVYQSIGAAERVIVVERAGRAAPVPRPPAAETPGGFGSAAPETVYIPPPTPPVYIPPLTPPVYVPPATPPVYVPPAEPPAYIPPATAPRAASSLPVSLESRAPWGASRDGGSR